MGKGSSTTTSTSAPSAAASNLINPAAADASTAASNPFQFFPGQTVAGLTPQQLAGMSEVNNATNVANPFINAASTMTQAGTQPIGASQINQYMNPYLSDVASTTSAEINQNNAIQQNQLQGNAAALGALGGNRVGTAQAQLANQQDLAENQQIANIYQGGYNTALGAAQTTNAQQLQGASLEGSLGTEAQNTQLAGANAQLAAGSTAQTQQQNELNSAFSQFEASQAFPFQSSQFLTGTDAELASLLGGTSATTVPPPSEFSQVVGGLGAVAGIAGSLKTGGRVGKDGGGGVVSPDYLNGLGTLGPVGGSTLPGAPPAFDPNAKTDGSQPNSGNSGGGGGEGAIAGASKLAAIFKKGGRANYDIGGGLPYDTGSAGYFPSMSFGAPHANSIPNAPAAFDPNGGTDGSQGKAAAQTGANVAKAAKSLYQQGQQVIGGQQSAVSGGLAPTPTSTFLNAPELEMEGTFINPNQNYNEGQAGISGGFAHGGRIGRAEGGSSNTASPSSGINTEIQGGQPSQEESMENYSMMAGLMPGSQPPAYHYGQSSSTPPEQSSSNMEYARGGIARVGRASGGTSGVAAAPATGSLPAFTPVGGQSVNAPQPATTAGTQPTTWGNVALPSAPQLSTAPVAQLTPQDIQASIALPTGGIQNNYTGYIEGLQGSNPSIGNRAPQTNTFGAAAPGAFSPTAATPTGTNAVNPDDFSTPDLTALMNGLSAPSQGVSTANFKKGGRTHYDDGGSITQYVPDGQATPLTSGNIPPDGAPTGPVGPQGNTVPPVAPVQSQPLAPPAPAQQGIGAISPAQAAPVAPKPVASMPPQGLAAAAPTPTNAGVAATTPQAQNITPPASNNLYQPPVNNPGNLRVPGSKTAFQQFKSPAEGWDAMSDQLVLDNKPTNEGGHGLSTISQIVSSWAPPTENDTASYIKNVSNETGIDPNSKIDLTDPAILGKVQTAMAHQEGGKAPPGTQMAQNLVQQPAYVNGQVASDASPNYLNPAGATQGNAGIPQPGNNPYSGDQTEVDKIANSPWTALAAAGFATMAGTSPYAAVNIGQGGLAGIQYLQGTENQQRQNAATQQAQTGVQQTSSAQRLQAGAQQNQYTIGLINSLPGISDTQRANITQNFTNSILGLPQVPVPGLPPGLPPFVASYAPGYAGSSRVSQPSVGQVSQQIPQPQTISAMNEPAPTPQSTTGSVGNVPQGTQQGQDQTQLMAPLQIGTLTVPAQNPSQRAMTMAAYSGMGGIIGPWAQQQSALAQQAISSGKFVNQFGQMVNVAGNVGAQAQGAEVQNQVATEGSGWGNLVSAQPSVNGSLTQLEELANAGTQAPAGRFQPAMANAASLLAGAAQVAGVPVPKNLTSYAAASDLINKINTQLAGNIQKSIGDTAYAGLQTIKQAVPSGSLSSLQSFQQVTRSIAQQLQFSQDMYNYGAQNRQADLQQNPNDPYAWQNQFLAQHPPEMYASRVNPLSLPMDAKGNPNIQSLRAGFNYVTPSGNPFQWNGSVPVPVNSLGNAAQ